MDEIVDAVLDRMSIEDRKAAAVGIVGPRTLVLVAEQLQLAETYLNASETMLLFGLLADRA